MSNPPPPLPPIVPLEYAQPVFNKVREVAIRQRAIMWGILAILAAYALLAMCALSAAPSRQFPIVPGIAVLIFLGAAITCAVLVFRFALIVYGTAGGIVLGFLTLIPFLGLLVLMAINGKATKILRENGIKVGFMGARPDQIPPV